MEVMTKQKFFNRDFSDLDLSGQDLSYSVFTCCKFRRTNLSNANCSYSDFTGCILDKTKCTNTNFMKSKLACYFHPSDCFGMTLSLECSTFKGMVISKMWWFGYVYFALLMEPEKDNGKDLKDSIIQAFGTDRYLRLKSLFSSREI